MKANEIRNVVVAGAGTMGASMAQIFAKNGYDVVLYDIADAALERGRNLVRVNQESQVASGDLTAAESAEIVSRLSYTMDKNCFAQCDLVVESILENLEIKQNICSRTREAYAKKDQALLQAVLADYKKMIRRTEEFHADFQTQWNTFHFILVEFPAW